MKWFGREPVYLMAFVAVALTEAVVLRTGAAAAAIVNLAQGVLALFLGFGLAMSAEQQSLGMLVVEGAVALMLRREVTAPVPEVGIEQSSPLARRGPTAV